MPVTGPSIVLLASQVVDLACVVSWTEDGSTAVVRLNADTFELDEIGQLIEAEYIFRLDLLSFEIAMQNYLDSLNQALGYLATEDDDFIVTEDLVYIEA